MTDLIQLLKQCSHQRPKSYRLYNFSCRLRNYNYDWPSSSNMWLPQIAHRQLHHLLHWLYQQLHKWIHSLIPSLKSIHHRLSQRRHHLLHSKITPKATKSGPRPIHPKFHHQTCHHMLLPALINILPHPHHRTKQHQFPSVLHDYKGDALEIRYGSRR